MCGRRMGREVCDSLYYFNQLLMKHRIRLYSTKSLKALGTLEYHKTGCQVVAFARSDPVIEGTPMEEDNDNDMDETERDARKRWLVGGGKDGRVSIWALIDFEKK
jgi:hypothetical protein